MVGERDSTIRASGPYWGFSAGGEGVQWSRITIIGGILGAIVVAGLIVLYNRGATPRFSGTITEVRTLGMDDASSVAIVNFQAENVSNREVSIQKRQMTIVDGNGIDHEGRVLSVFDVQQLFKYFPALGGMRDEPLTDNRFVEAGESFRGLVAARFEIPKHELDLRQEIVLHTMDVKHRKTELRLDTE